jgi:two-component sensor histidine kinase
LTSKEPPAPDPEHPVVEPPQGERPEPSQSALRLRIRQQELLAELGVIALKRTTFSALFDGAVRMAAEGLEAEFCKLLEFYPAENRLVLVAGVGWEAGLIGVASVGADLESPSGFALRTGKPVISNHLEQEERFRTPDLLRAHGVRRAINVILQGEGAPFGVLEVDSRSPGEFSEHDIAFLQGAANILGMAIERQHHERNLRNALEHQKVLVNEINHRVKNSLQLVASLLNLQAAAADEPEVSQSLQEAMARVTAVARIHERLYRSPDVVTVDLAAYLADICTDLAGLAPQCEIVFQTEAAIPMPTDRAVHVALLATELITNAAKHAGPGRIVVRLSAPRVTPWVTLSVRDEGQGLPEGFSVGRAQSLGMKIIRALIEQMGAGFTVNSAQPGAEFVVKIPTGPQQAASDPMREKH